MILLLLFTGAIIFGFYYYNKYIQGKTKVSTPKKEAKPEVKESKTQRKVSHETNPISNKDLKRQELESKKNLKKIKKTNPTHSCFMRGFKGFREKVCDFDVSADGLYVVACSPDCTFRVYKSKDLNDQDPLTVYQKIDFYEPCAISLKGDKKLVAVGMGDAKMVEFHNLEEYEEDDKTKIKISLSSRSADKLHKTNLKHLFLDMDGKFYVTGSDEDDTSIKAWSLNGDSLGTFTTAQLRNHHIQRSENGRFLAVGAWTSDVMVLELKANKDGTLKSLGKAMTLRGHRQGIIDLAFNTRDDKIVTLSKDQTLKLWDINVRYEMSEDPRCLATINVSEHEQLKNLGGLVRLALYTNEQNTRDLILISQQSDIHVFDVQKNKVIETIDNAHSEGSNIYKMMFKEHKGKPYLYTCGDDGRVNMWNFEKI